MTEETPAPAKPAPKIAIWPCRPIDAVQIMKLLRRQFDESEIAYAGFDDGPALIEIVATIGWGFAIKAVASPDEHGNGRIVGTMAQEPGKLWWRPSFKFLDNKWLYVHPDWRDGRVTDALIETMLQLVDRAGAPMAFSNLNGTRPDARDRFVRRFGFTYAGGVFVRGFGDPPQAPTEGGGGA